MLARVRAVLLAAVLALVLTTAAGSQAGSKRSTATADVYKGLGTWIDVYDARAFANPEATATTIASRGVKTVYVETSNSKQSVDIVKPDALGRLVDALHHNEIEVVAWYLPTLVKPAVDLRRSLAAIQFTTPEGAGFQGFALDIEAPDVKSLTVRNARALALSRQLRAAAGRDLGLAAIIPSPRGMEIRPTYWPGFPYAQLAALYDAFLPMTYFTGTAKALMRSTATSRIARDPPHPTQNPELPIHMIAGVANRATLPEVQAFAQLVADDTHIAGWSLYDFFTKGPPSGAFSPVSTRSAVAESSSRMWIRDTSRKPSLARIGRDMAPACVTSTGVPAATASSQRARTSAR